MTTTAKIEVLKAVRLLIDRQETEFICHALDSVGQLHPNLEGLCTALGDYVQAALWYNYGGGISKCYTFTQWIDRHVSSFDDLGGLERRRIGLLGRLAWLDRMIDDLQTKGFLP